MEDHDRPPITFSQARAAAVALQNTYATKTKRRESPPIFLIFNFKKAPSKSSGPHRIRLPSPVRHFPFQTATMFVSGEAAPWQETFKKTGLEINAISLSMLRKHYSTRKARDTLLHSSTFFYCEENAATSLPSLLGSQFFSRNRQPIRVRLDVNDSDQIMNELKEATECAEFYIKHDVNTMLRVGNFGISFDALGENILQGFQQAWDLIPKAKARVVSITLMTSGQTIPPFWEKNPKKLTLTPENVIVQEEEETKHTDKKRKKQK